MYSYVKYTINFDTHRVKFSACSHYGITLIVPEKHTTVKPSLFRRSSKEARAAL